MNDGKRQERDHVQCEVVRILENPADGALDTAPFARLFAAGVVEHRAKGDIARREHQQPREPLDAAWRGEDVHHQEKIRMILT